MTEFLTMHTAEDAWTIFREHFAPEVRVESCPLAEALDRTLADDVVAHEDLPSFVRSTVDGYAVRSTDTHGASSSLPAYLDVIGEAPMGVMVDLAVAPGQAVLVHTGGMAPAGSDAVVMLEYTSRTGALLGPPAASEQGGFGIEVYRPVAGGENCIQIGEDVRVGDLVMAAGRTLRPQELGGLAALGVTDLRVARKPLIAIVSQGDEVVPAAASPAPGQVRDVNSYTLAALVRRAGGIPINYPIVPDRQEELDAAARQAWLDADLVVLTAGSSVSYRDLTAGAIASLGRPGVLVHGVAVRPGKPTILAVCDGKPVFGLPGNPVSCINIFELFVTPTIRLLLGAGPKPAHQVQARLSRNVGAASGRADFVRVHLTERDGELWAAPIFGKSNLIYTLVRSEGVVKVPLNSNGIPAGSLVKVTLDW